MTTASPGVISLFLENQHYAEPRGVPPRARRGDAHRVRGAPRLRDAPADRLPRPRRRAPRPVPGHAAGGVEAHDRAARRGAQRRDPRHPAGGDAHPPLLGQLRGAAQPRRPARGDPRRSSSAPGPRRSPSSSPTRGTSTSGASSRTSTCPTTRSSSPASSTRRRTTSSTRTSSPSASSGSRGSSGASASSRARDCGFATFAGFAPVFPSIVYAKLGALAEGAERASAELWTRPSLETASRSSRSSPTVMSIFDWAKSPTSRPWTIS